MKIDIGDSVIPIYLVGKVAKIRKDEVVIEYRDSKGEIREHYVTEDQAKAAGVTLDQYVDMTIVKIPGINQNDND
jgi:hypothetical protein